MRSTGKLGIPTNSLSNIFKIEVELNISNNSMKKTLCEENKLK